MDGQAGEQMCPVCTLYLRPGMTLHEHLFTHPKDQVIEALVRIAALNCASAVTTVNTNSHQQFTAITYRQFQTLTTSVPETNIPLMLNPCLVNSSSPFSSGVIRSSVPLLSYPYYPPEQQNSSNLSEQRVENNTQCSYTYTSQTTQTTRTNSPFVTNNNSPFTEVADCEEVQNIDDNCENYELDVDPFVSEQSENPNSPTNLSDIQEADDLHVNKKINGVHTTLNSPVNCNIVSRNGNTLVSRGLANLHDSNVDPLDINNSDENDKKHGHLHHKDNLSHQEKDNLINTAHSLGTVISNTHRLISHDPTLDYDQDLRIEDIDYSEQNYDNLSPNRNVVSPVSDASNWSSGSGIRVRRDLSSLDESDKLRILYVRQNSNASEYVTSDPFDEENGHQQSGGQLTNLNNVNFSSIGLYSTNQNLTGRNMEDNEHKEDNSIQSVPLNIHSDELMPPRGELSGQESLGATENSVWELQVSVLFVMFPMLVVVL